MDIAQKISLSQRPIQFFKQGVFIKLFNESLYVVNHYYQLPLKPDVALIKSLNKIVIASGFPLSLMDKYFSQVTVTNYDYQLITTYNLSNYDKWYYQCCQTVERALKQ